MPLAEPTGRVLVVDDELEVREALKRILQKENLEVATAADGSEALSLFAAGRFQLVITDLIMPGLDGLRLLTELRLLQPTLPVLIMTAYGGWDTYLDAMNSGAFNYVTKPIKREDLLRLVRDAIAAGASARADATAPGEAQGGGRPADA